MLCKELKQITMKNTLTLLILILIPSLIFAQEGQHIEMADGLLQSGKIYVVVTVLAVIFTGIVIYLISIDRKITKLENELHKK
jgi:CcmD family protein